MPGLEKILMKEDTFFNQENCDRCGGKLSSRIMSWFTNECICMSCSEKEKAIRSKLPNYGDAYEGIGYVPKIN